MIYKNEKRVKSKEPNNLSPSAVPNTSYWFSLPSTNFLTTICSNPRVEKTLSNPHRAVT